MAGPQRPTSGLPTRRSALRQTTRRVGTTATERPESVMGNARTVTASAPRVQRAPSEQPSNPTKRKEREFEHTIGEDTSIHVVVRCRGRNDREVKENSGVVVSTEGVKGTSVELSMGPNAVSNKTYNFDKVFSPAADQAIVFDDVVAPVLTEMLAGFNCTIFAYGQTGTGKTYTMSGDMTDTLGILSDNAGIIPRVLYSLFQKLEDTESTVKCSFIELYNEELRDLLSVEENPKLKIFENEPRKGHSGSTMVQGMEETYIDSATTGIKLLQKGSHKRQVAATKCNDLSSRSHTIFTITVYTKRTTESGEDYISSGKLNLVDLAGSENIQRSGAENKRATEAGLINKSLLTLGRVINALVDKSAHIPYRESKLTRLLQDSLGGRTKTCIIATISPSRSNLEETMSTLDYAFRAKNIRNKPQINSTMAKKTLLREFTVEIEKLKSELIATRHRNGVYMTADAYEEMTMESESRRIVNEEQRAKIESMESSLRHKVQELLTLTSNFNNLKKDNEDTRVALNNTNDILQQTEIVLKDTRDSLEEEEMLRQAHQDTEAQLHGIGTNLLSTLKSTLSDVNGLHAKIQRKTDLHDTNLQGWQSSADKVTDVTSHIESKVEQFQIQQARSLQELATKINQHVISEFQNIQVNRSELHEFTMSFDKAEEETKEQTIRASHEMNDVLEGIKVLREEVKLKVGEGLNGLSAAAARISKDVIGELADFHTQLRGSYASLGSDLKTVFESLAQHMSAQSKEILELRQQLQEANRQTIEANRQASMNLTQAMEEEQANVEAERDALVSKINALVEESRQRQYGRLKRKINDIGKNVASSGDVLERATTQYRQKIDHWMERDNLFAAELDASRGELEERMDNDWETFDSRNVSIQKATEAVHEETVRIVDAQMEDMATQMAALDDFVAEARSQNGRYCEAHMNHLDTMAATVRRSYSTFDNRFQDLNGRVGQMKEEVLSHTHDAQSLIDPLSDEVRQPLSNLRDYIQSRPLQEYVVTGETPRKTNYQYSTSLPRTEQHDSLRSRMRNSKQLNNLPFSGEDQLSPVDNAPVSLSPAKTFVYNDVRGEAGNVSHPTDITSPLREVDVNIAKQLASDAGSTTPTRKLSMDKEVTSEKDDVDQRPAKRHCPSTATADSKLPQKAVTRRMASMLEGRENVPLSTPSGGRRLRNRQSD
ncbi:hypothetical protein ASPZODRAFT_55698 [Penicilliopsis zonata CBS 506.65]|uniref:Kinesin motor domain-containing protein n=1 Tax=Penicilliopsis zonata CBS 506.65 TaxID=1073090 RepID=A0A1L9SX26_9EURO|nr:hypothetical protein ASPZODRAFT_55698 [Penicilliopsis zonata CBS 506.65]OJJ51758.1 hypothetical protein ASPZODRAFT_55698 [Penicilliopsis zonata CBS 506.65]